ncbi:IS256 family transposase [Pontibacter qinzhouensis]|uniref:Mutator family transposase n=1 Tax=Pontibacter qinzhouensis TaxID=2603253 RepID=A0A5C8ICK6_9BACT|nr:IS256 family transposase [Pontibacter qinzhouensis]
MAGLYAGQSLTGEQGIFAPLLKHFLEAALEGEMAAHLQEGKSVDTPSANRRNGKARKQVKSLSGEFELQTPRDREGSFEPQVVGKRQVIITEGLEEKVIALYAMGNSFRDISRHIQELYGMALSATQLSEITDKVVPAMNQWRGRPLDSLYCFLYLDCMHYKVRSEGKVVARAVYNVLGINQEGRKELIGMYVAESEGAKFWLSVLSELKTRGVEDVLIACVDGLKGFPEAIETVFPAAQVQLCVIHQIRNTLRYVVEKDKKAFMADLKPVYQALNQEEGYLNLLALEEKWGKKYPVAVQSWFNNWEHLATFFAYDAHIRRAIYTTNAIEGLHRQVRKVTKTKGAFTSDAALLKLIYLVVMNVEKKWTMPLPNWALTFSQLFIMFEERIRPHLRV